MMKITRNHGNAVNPGLCPLGRNNKKKKKTYGENFGDHDAALTRTTKRDMINLGMKICLSQLRYSTSFVGWVSVFGVHLNHHRAGRFLLLHYRRVIRAIGEHRLVVMIFIELKAQEKRTAISAGVSRRGPKEMSAGLIGKLGAARKGRLQRNKALDKSKRSS